MAVAGADIKDETKISIQREKFEYLKRKYLPFFEYLRQMGLFDISQDSEHPQQHLEHYIKEYFDYISEGNKISFPNFLSHKVDPLPEPIKLLQKNDPQAQFVADKGEFKIDVHGLTRRGQKQAIFRLLANAKKSRAYKITFGFLPQDNTDFRKKTYQQIRAALENLGRPWIITPGNESDITNQWKQDIVINFPYQNVKEKPVQQKEQLILEPIPPPANKPQTVPKGPQPPKNVPNSKIKQRIPKLIKTTDPN